MYSEYNTDCKFDSSPGLLDTDIPVDITRIDSSTVALSVVKSIFVILKIALGEFMPDEMLW